MSAINFLNPALLWSLGLASIPIIIHLLFRRQFLRIDWAPMRYLKLTIERNRRRVQIEQLLLLLMRIAIIALLAFLVARPVVNFAGWGSWLAGSTRTSRVVVLDDSLSMGLIVGDRTSFNRAVELATHIAAEVGSQDRVTLVLASQPKAPLMREVEMIDADQLRLLLRKQKPSGAFVSWATAMAAIDELVASSTYPTREVTLVTDLRRAGWEENLKEIADRWAAEGVRLQIFNVGGDAVHQVVLRDFALEDACVLAGAPAHWQAIVHNTSSENLDRVEATLLVDGKPNPLQLPALAAGEQSKVPVTATFQEPGLHHISLRLPNDDLLADNERWNAVEVRDQLRMALVDGQPASEPLAGAADFLALALSLGTEESQPFVVELQTDAELAVSSESTPDVIALADVATLSQRDAQRLHSFVQSGHGLMIFVGDGVDPDVYNQVLGRGGVDLLPAQLESVADQPVTGFVLENESPSPLDALRQLNPAVLERIRTNKFYQVQLPPDSVPGVRVLARWNDTQASPAAIEKNVGRGHVILWTIPANKAWNDWPTEPSFVLAMREAAKAMVRTSITRDLTAGEPIQRPIAADAKITSPQIELPNATEPASLLVELNDSTNERPSSGPNPQKTLGKFLAYNDTRQPGLYRLNWQADPGGQGTDLFAVNPDVRESDLTPISPDELKAMWDNLHPEIYSINSTASEISTRGREIWRPMAWCLLALLAVEACFATWAGRQR